MTRAYVPATVAQVVAWHSAGAVPAGTPAVTVSQALREAHPQADEEELEYLATRQALDAAGGARPAVLAVDLPAEVPALTADVPVSAWAALFVGDLEWYAVGEIPHLA